jgi:hypothetical protein
LTRGEEKFALDFALTAFEDEEIALNRFSLQWRLEQAEAIVGK